MSSFLSVKTPKHINGTVTVTIKNKEYISKHYNYWSKLDRLSMIPLEEGPENQVDILNVSELDGQKILLFSRKDGKTIVHSDIEVIIFKD